MKHTFYTILLFVISACQKEDPGISCGRLGYVMANDNDTTCFQYARKQYNYELEALPTSWTFGVPIILDVDGNGQDDFEMRYLYEVSGITSVESFLYIRPMTEDGEIAVRDTFVQYPVSDSVTIVVRRGQDEKIDATANWKNTACYVWQWEENYTYPGLAYDVGGWDAGYIPVRLKAGSDFIGGYKYGWIKIAQQGNDHIIVSSLMDM